MDILPSAESIDKNCTVAELDMIAKVYKDFTKSDLGFKSSDRKTVKVNRICEKLGDRSKIQVKKRKVRNAVSLSAICKRFVLPIDVLAAAPAKIHYLENMDEWESKCCVEMGHEIPGTLSLYSAYCYPEYCVERKEILCRILGPTHILTNMKSHCTRKHMDIYKCDSFMKVSKANNDVLPHAIICDMINNQLL